MRVGDGLAHVVVEHADVEDDLLVVDGGDDAAGDDEVAGALDVDDEIAPSQLAHTAYGVDALAGVHLKAGLDPLVHAAQGIDRALEGCERRCD